MRFSYYRHLISSDLFRHCGDTRWRSFLRHFVWTPGYKYAFWLRTAAFTRVHYLLWPLHFLARLILRRLQFKYGIQISYDTNIGPGFYIGHWGGIVVHPDVRIGRNCNINHDVTIGMAYGGQHPGCPVVGDNVYLGPGSRVIGGITLGNDVAIGANAVVTKSVPDTGVAVGVPAEVKSLKGSYAYVIHTDYSADPVSP